MQEVIVDSTFLFLLTTHIHSTPGGPRVLFLGLLLAAFSGAAIVVPLVPKILVVTP